MAGIVYISPSGGGISKIKEGTKTTLSGVIIGDGTTISSVASDYYIQTTGIIAFTGIQSYNTHKLFTEDTQIIDKKYVDDAIHSKIDEVSGSVVELDTTNFDGILSDKDTQVQHAFDTIDDITTTNIPEGINLYYTDSRARLSIGETIPGISYNSGTGIFSLEPDYVIPRTTSDIPEGSNLYHTDARSRSSISETITGILYNSGTGVFSLEEGYIIPKTTTDIPEGNNLYYTNSRARSAINEVISGISYDPETGIFSLEENYIIPRTTSDIPEGINKYYTDSRSRSAISETIIGISYNSGTGVFSLDEGYVIPQTTSDIPEGTNLYYTDARVRAAISITSNGLNYNSDTGVLSVSSGYIIPTTTDELNWNEAYSKEHDQNTDIGTTSTIFILGSNESSPIKLKNELGTLRLRNNNDSDDANLVIGNLTVNGTQTVIHSTVLEVDDNTITVNAGTSGTPVLDGGLIVDRGDFTNASILWNESSDKWIAGLLGSEAIIWTENTDGEGSGLDADLLDGRHASYFAVSGHVHSQLSSLDADDHTQYIRTDGLRSFTGVISYDSPKTFNSNLQIIDKKYVDDSIISLSGSAISYTNQQLEILSGSVISYTNQQIETLSGFVNTNYVKTNEYKDIDVLNKIKNVDGVDSGLDADLLDGQHASYFASQFNLDILSGTVDNTTVKLTGNQTISGIKTFNNFLITPSSLPNSDYEVANKKYVDEQIATKDNHEELEGLLGGSIDEHYHLTSGQLYELTSGVSTDLHSHEIYILADGTRSFTGVVQYDSHPSFSVDTELVDKKYVDDKIENVTSDHEKLEGLLGGDTNNHWHLTSDQHNELTSGQSTILHTHTNFDQEVEFNNIVNFNNSETPFTVLSSGVVTNLNAHYLDNYSQTDFSLIDGSRNFTNIVRYDSHKIFVNDTDIVDKKYVDDFIITSGSTNATTLDGYHAGNISGAIPINNGILNTNLNADMLDGYHASSFRRNHTITYLSKSGHNSQAIISNSKLYTTSGNNANYWAWTTGRHSNSPTHYGVDSFKIVQLPQDSPIKKVGGFVSPYAFVLLEDGRLYTWGYNSAGQCGLGHTNTVAIPTLAATNVIDAYSHPSQGEYGVNDSRLFILKSDGLYAAGYNAGGQLGVGDTATKSSFTKCTVFTSGAQIKKVYPIGCTSGYTFVLTTDGKIYFAGTNNTGVCGDDTTANKTSFTDVTSYWAGVSSDVKDIKVVGGSRYYDNADGGSQPSAIMLITLSDDSTIIKACGNNQWGQLGDGTTTQRTTPVTPLNVPGGSIIDIAGFGSSPLTVQALASNGDLWAWGYNGQGQVGDGTTTNRTTPIVVTTGVQKLFSDGMTSYFWGYNTQSFIRKADGLYACGMNDEGYCGLGHTTNPITTHTKVSLYLTSDEYVDDIGHYTTYNAGRIIIAVTNKGNLFAWGYNGDYGVGGNTTNKVLVPIQFTIQEGV